MQIMLEATHTSSPLKNKLKEMEYNVRNMFQTVAYVC